MKLNVLFIRIFISSLLLMPFIASAEQVHWAEATNKYCKEYLTNYEPPGFWVNILSWTSDTTEKTIQTRAEIAETCIKLDRGLISIGDANLKLRKHLIYLLYEQDSAMVKELIDDFVSSFIGFGKFLLLLLGTISTIVAIFLGVKSLLGLGK